MNLILPKFIFFSKSFSLFTNIFLSSTSLALISLAPFSLLASELQAIDNRPQASSGLGDFILPFSKTGINDYYYAPPELEERYLKVFSEINHGMRSYNIWWSALEDGVKSSSTPLNCPPHQLLYPPDTATKNAFGYHNFHCYNSGYIRQFDRALAEDQEFGVQSVAVLWSTPPKYQNPGCQGFFRGASVVKEGCVPDAPHMNDFEDYVNFLAHRYNESNESGKLNHFIVWNEVADGGWFDHSPTIPKGSVPTAITTQHAWVDKYVDMFKRVFAAVRRHNQHALLYVSLDHIVQGPGIRGITPHLGGYNFLQLFWNKVGLSMDWSIAIHAYGEPMGPFSGRINFRALDQLISFQNAQLEMRGIRDYLSKPQSLVYASEQGWLRTQYSQVKRAQFICEAHNLIVGNPHVIGATHTNFQDRTGNNAFGLIPQTVQTNLIDVDNDLTWQAYKSTNPNRWGVSNDHYCCSVHSLGCYPN